MIEERGEEGDKKSETKRRRARQEARARKRKKERELVKRNERKRERGRKRDRLSSSFSVLVPSYFSGHAKRFYRTNVYSCDYKKMITVSGCEKPRH